MMDQRKALFVVLLLTVWLSLESLVLAGQCDGVRFVSRAGWGARRPRSTPRRIRGPVAMSFIHHSETPGCQDFKSCATLMRSIQNFHMDRKGWGDIGYSFLIGGDGRVYEGRGWGIVGAHTYGYNSVALGFCLLGSFKSRTPTPAAVAATKRVLGCGIEKGYIRARFELFGHRDGGCTDCPGNALYRMIQSWPSFSRRKIRKYCVTNNDLPFPYERL